MLPQAASDRLAIALKLPWLAATPAPNVTFQEKRTPLQWKATQLKRK